MVAGFFWTNHRTEKGKNQCNFGPLYTPFVKLSIPFYREEYHPRKHHFCLFKQKTWRVNQEAVEPFLGRKKNKTARFTIPFLCCILFSLLLRTVIALSRTKDAFAWKILLVLVLKSEGLSYDHFV